MVLKIGLVLFSRVCCEKKEKTVSWEVPRHYCRQPNLPLHCEPGLKKTVAGITKAEELTPVTVCNSRPCEHQQKVHQHSGIIFLLESFPLSSPYPHSMAPGIRCCSPPPTAGTQLTDRRSNTI